MIYTRKAELFRAAHMALQSYKIYYEISVLTLRRLHFYESD